MVALVKLLGIVIVVFGVFYLSNPKILKGYLNFWKKGKRIYIGAALSLLIGIIFLRAAAQCAVSWFITLFGVLALIKGIVLFAAKQEKAISMMEWWLKRPNKLMRTHAIFAIAIGILLIYCA